MNMENSELLSEVKRLITEVNEERRQARRTAVTFSVCVLVVFLAFALILKNKVENNFSTASVQNALTERIASFEPLIRSNIDQVLDGVPETYKAAFVNEMHRALPKIKRDSLNETQALVAGLTKRFEKKLQKALDPAALKGNEAFAKLYQQKGAETAAAWEEMRKELAAKLDVITRDSATRLHNNFRDDVQLLMASARTFPRSSPSKTVEKTAASMFASYWMQLMNNH